MWRLFFSYLLTLLFICSIHGQDGSYASTISESEKQFIIRQLQDRFWGSDRSNYNTPTPVAYQNEDAIILDQSTSREFYRNSRNHLRTSTLEHKVIRILSKEGLAKNTVFSYEHIDSEFAFDVTAVKIIKPDGRERILELDSISVSKSYDRVDYREFIIPGLQVGDILDFYYYLEFRVVFPQQYSRVFDPVYHLPQGEYPILNYRLEFILGPSAFINVSSNKLPGFEAVNYKIDRKTFSKFHVDLQDLDPIDLGLESFYPFKELPSLKYQVFIAPYSGNSDIVYNLGGSLKLNEHLQPSRLQDYLNFTLAGGRDYKQHYMNYLSYLKGAGMKRKRMEKGELALHYYYYMRGSRELNKLNDSPIHTDDYQYISRANYVLSKMKVGHKILLGFDRSQTELDQFILIDEITPMLLVEAADTFILNNPLFNNAPGEIGAKYEGSTAYTFNPVNFRMAKWDIPPGKSEDNVWRSDIEVTMIPNGEADVESMHVAGGHLKENFQRQLLNKAELYLNGDVPTFPNLWTDRYAKKKGLVKAKEKYSSLIETKNQEIESSIKRRLEVGDLKVYNINWDLVSNGVSKESPMFSWMETWQTDQLGRKGSDSYLIVIKDIIGNAPLRNGIVEGRTTPLNFDYPLIREGSLYLNELPGYELGDIQDMSFQVENFTGSFESNAVYNDGGVILHFKLDWNGPLNLNSTAEALEIQQAYLNFLQQKVLYRKKTED